MENDSIQYICLDPLDWMPGHGSSGYVYAPLGINRYVGINYEHEENGILQLRQRSYTFPVGGSLVIAASPGPSLLEDIEMTLLEESIGSFGEVLGSPWARKWTEHWQESMPFVQFHHYMLSLAADNVMFHIAAKGWSISDPITICKNYDDPHDEFNKLCQRYNSEEKASTQFFFDQILLSKI